MKKNVLITLIFSILFIATTIIPLISIQATSTDSGTFKGIQWEYGELQFNTHIVSAFNDEVYSYEDSGVSDYIYNYSCYGYDGSYIYESQYMIHSVSDYYTNMTEKQSGNLTLDYNVLADYVNIVGGKTINYTWYGAKNARMIFDYWISDMEFYNFYNSTGMIEIWTTTTKKEASTMNIVDITYDYYMQPDNFCYAWNSSEGGSFNEIQHMIEVVDFVIPIQISNLKMTSKNGENVVWSNVICEAYIFNDLNKNGIFDAGRSNTAAGALPSMQFSDEFIAFLMPYGLNATMISQSYDKMTLVQTSENEMSMNFPSDFNATALADNFALIWNPPVETDGVIQFSWSQSADQLPTALMGPIYPPPELETDYNFGNVLSINKTGLIALESSITFAKVENTTIKALVENYSLALPYYTSFIAPGEVFADQLAVIPKQANNWDFKLKGTTIAEIDFDNPLKEEYTLMDYPTPGNQSTLPCQGSSVAKILVNLGQQILPLLMSGPGPAFGTMNYGLVEEYNLPGYNTSFSYELVNYPIWGGNQIVHDPIFVAHTSEITTEGGVPGFEYLYILITLPLIIIYYLQRIIRKEKLV